MSEDLIKRSDAIESLNDCTDIKGFEYRQMHDALMEIQRADRPQGEWIDDDFVGQYRCSECDYYAIDEYDYCPNCGADMRKGADDNRDYERAAEQREYDVLYESTYNPEDGSM